MLPRPEILSDEKINGKTQTVNLLDYYPNKKQAIYDRAKGTVAEPVYKQTSVSAINNQGFEEYKGLLAQMKAERDAAVEAAYQRNKEALVNAKKDAMSDAYRTYMHGIKNMQQISAIGGNGGYAQSLLGKQQINYENNRNNINSKYLDNIRELEADRAAKILSSGQDYMGQLAEMIKSKTPKSITTKQPIFTGKYKVNGRTMSKSEYLQYLNDMGYSGEQAADYMEENGLPY